MGKGILLFYCVFSTAWPGQEKTIHWDAKYHNRPWVNPKRGHRHNLRQVLDYLQQSVTGRSILAAARNKARGMGKQLHQLILPGSGSLTNTTLLRRFHPRQKMQYRVHSEVLLNQGLTTMGAVLDLVHELTHFIQRSVFNPYSRQFTAAHFLLSTIQGKGGEIAAYIVECKVLDELFPRSSIAREQCHRIRGKDGSYSPHKAARLFYQVGEHYGELSRALRSLGADPAILQLLSPEQPVFISSVHDRPYPLAVLLEYRAIMEKACRNDRKNMSLLGVQQLRDYFHRCSRLDVAKSLKIR